MFLVLVGFIYSPGRIIVHCNRNDEARCARIISQLGRQTYRPELNGQINSSTGFKNIQCIVCCLSSNYEKDEKRRSELQYAFKSQQRIVPVTIQSDFRATEAWLTHILDYTSAPIIDLSGSKRDQKKSSEQLSFEVNKLKDGADLRIGNASVYVRIYQVCCNQGWIDLPKVLLRIPVALLKKAFDQRLPHEMAQIMKIMYSVNDQFGDGVKSHIDSFHGWLKDNYQEDETNNSPTKRTSDKKPRGDDAFGPTLKVKHAHLHQSR